MSKKTVKLTPKELEVVSNIQTQKQKLFETYQANVAVLNQSEGVALELIMERAKITEKPSAVNIEGKSLVFEFAKKEKETKKETVNSEE